MDAISLINEGLNVEMQEIYVNIAKINFVIQYNPIDECKYWLSEGIGNSMRLDNITMTGKNKGGFNRVMLV